MKVNTEISAVEEVLTRGVQEIVVADSLKKKMLSGKQLRIKHGVDPTSTDLHLGYAVVYEKLRQFQELGHKIVFLIGSFTARFGDPTDKGKVREMKTKEAVMEMAKEYIKQLGKIIDIKKIEVVYNGNWYDKFSAEDLLNLMSKFTVARMLERDMFQQRMKEAREIYLHEPVYPVLQGYDSVVIKSDITVIGSDQKFNELQARPLQEAAGQVPQDLMMVPLLIGTDGEQKMSQSLGNYIGIADSPQDQFGKTMSIPDSLIYSYFELCTRVDASDLYEIEKQLKSGENPRNIKVRLAKEIVKIYHGERAAQKAEEEFINVFSNKQKPTNIPKFVFREDMNILGIMVASEMVTSNSEGRRMVEQKAVKVNEIIVSDIEQHGFKAGDVVQVGKRRYIELV